MSIKKQWPSRFGELGEKVFGKDDPFNNSTSDFNNRNIVSDEMPPTRSPISGKYYTSKTALRAEYKAHGAEEVGTAYDNGYAPEKEAKAREDAFVRKLTNQVIERYKNGR